MKGGELQFDLGSQPNKQWGSRDKDQPQSAITDHTITPVPFFEGRDKKFKGSARIKLRAIEPGTELYYSLTFLGQKYVPKNFKRFNGEVSLTASGNVYAYAVKDGRKSKVVVQPFYRVPEDKAIVVHSTVNPLYTAGGPDALIDGIKGGANYRTGEWQSYEGRDFEAVVDLKSEKPVTYIGAHFLQDVGSWIWMPKEVSFEVSKDGKEFKPVGVIKNTEPDQSYTATVKDLGLKVSEQARYVRIRAVNYGTIPDWHPGKGGKAHIFIDEVIVR
jgi:hypothetical protein